MYVSINSKQSKISTPKTGDKTYQSKSKENLADMVVDTGIPVPGSIPVSAGIPKPTVAVNIK